MEGRGWFFCWDWGCWECRPDAEATRARHATQELLAGSYQITVTATETSNAKVTATATISLTLQ